MRVFLLYIMVSDMPQITCPNCGTTINLENRREVDVSLIKNATGKQPRTFTELLHFTKLSRKTLNSRLKDLCKEGVLAKEEGMYRLNGAAKYENNGGNGVRSFSRLLNDRRIRAGLTLAILLMSFSVSGYVLATFLAPSQHVEPPGPTILGDFTMALSVTNVKDLYAWQVVIVFDSSELKVLQCSPGDFVGDEYPFFVNSTNVGDGAFLLGGTLYGNVAGKDDSGRLATITFGYIKDNYHPPKIAMQQGYLETMLLNSNAQGIELNDSTELTLTSLQK
jgi:DNA-binding Lrp family transcriptional regulator